MRYFVHGIFIILITLVTFFGLGPVLLADGSIRERLITAAVVIVIYFIIAWIYRKALHWIRKKRK